jgi:hypothetical protein
VLAHDLGRIIFDGFVKIPISALRFIPLSLRRTARTPHSTGFARLELGLITKPSGIMTWESIIFGVYGKAALPWVKDRTPPDASFSV